MTAEPIFPPDRVTLLGVVNVTPDSFSDGGCFVGQTGPVDVAAASAAARRLVQDGAHVLDVGGESTRPGAAEVSVAAEIARTRPVVAALAAELGVPVSIDTRKAQVAQGMLAGIVAFLVTDSGAVSEWRAGHESARGIVFGFGEGPVRFLTADEAADQRTVLQALRDATGG